MRALFKPLAPIGRAIWNHYYLGCAGLFGAMAFLPQPVSHRIDDVLLGFGAWVAWTCDRRSQRAEDDGAEGWNLAHAFYAELTRRDGCAVSWPDFTQAVRDNMPDEQSEAVQYAMDLAISSLTVRTAH